MVGIIGIGYQRKSDQEVIAEFRQAGVRLVVDVRANPYAWAKKSLLNRNRAEHALAEHGTRSLLHHLVECRNIMELGTETNLGPSCQGRS